MDCFRKRLGGEFFAGLQRGGNDWGQPHLVNRLAKIDIWPNRLGASPDERTQTFAETGLRHLRHVGEAIGIAQITQMAMRNERVLRRFLPTDSMRRCGVRPKSLHSDNPRIRTTPL